VCRQFHPTSRKTHASELSHWPSQRSARPDGERGGCEGHTQGSCGSCWAFAVATVSMDQACLATLRRHESLTWQTDVFAPQHMDSCDVFGGPASGVVRPTLSPSLPPSPMMRERRWWETVDTGGEQADAHTSTPGAPFMRGGVWAGSMCPHSRSVGHPTSCRNASAPFTSSVSLVFMRGGVWAGSMCPHSRSAGHPTSCRNASAPFTSSVSLVLYLSRLRSQITGALTRTPHLSACGAATQWFA
jgi:hypothetical protein